MQIAEEHRRDRSRLIKTPDQICFSFLSVIIAFADVRLGPNLLASTSLSELIYDSLRDQAPIEFRRDRREAASLFVGLNVRFRG